MRHSKCKNCGRSITLFFVADTEFYGSYIWKHDNGIIYCAPPKVAVPNDEKNELEIVEKTLRELRIENKEMLTGKKIIFDSLLNKGKTITIGHHCITPYNTEYHCGNCYKHFGYSPEEMKLKSGDKVKCNDCGYININS